MSFPNFSSRPERLRSSADMRESCLIRREESHFLYLMSRFSLDFIIYNGRVELYNFSVDKLLKVRKDRRKGAARRARIDILVTFDNFI